MRGCTQAPDAGPARPRVSAREHGAVGDGQTLDTAALQRTLDAAAACAGVALLPPGTYLSGALFLHSGVTLELQRGATLLGSQRLADYPLRPTRVAGIEMVWPAALLNIYEQAHVALIGEGCIDGDGKVFWDSYWALRQRYEPLGLRWASDYDAQRPRLIQVYGSRQVFIGGGLLLRRAGFWGLHLCYSEQVTVDGLVVRNNGDAQGEGDARGPSTDGIDIDSSRDILIQHADIAANDDAIVFKAGRDADGLRVARPTEQVLVRDCVVREGAAGVSFGSETAGGFRDIIVQGLRVLAPVPVGVLFKSTPTRGGFGERITLRDIQLQDVGVALRVSMNWNPAYSQAHIPDALPPGLAEPPSYWAVLAQPVPLAQGLTHWREVRIEGLRARGAERAFEVHAHAQAPLQRFSLADLDIQARQGGYLYGSQDWRFERCRLSLPPGQAVALPGPEAAPGLDPALTRLQAQLALPDPARLSYEEQDKA